ncbi:MAG: CHASE2 domain-containing protein [Opitutae bacterium]|nr:CHASE2 domain-containing protein [Opitutae bacterium]MBT5716446.1 CHASE2 domain-containing protein [Opitutae bacterium]
MDLRLSSDLPGARGEIVHNNNSEEKIIVEGNKSIPKIPKVVYVNFDAATLSMDDVGERPWDRAFFRDMSMALMEKGRARVIAFDFGFTPKSMSKMVPKENSYRSDSAMGELIRAYPNQVVLGCLYSGVPTPFVKATGASAFPPLFKDGYSIEAARNSGSYNYPESPTYPLQNYLDGQYLGRTGSFTVPPYRYGFPGEGKPAVDNVPRWVPLWFPGGGKAHAYNLLGGKQSKLPFEMLLENLDEHAVLVVNLKNFTDQKEKLIEEITSIKAQILEYSRRKSKVENLYNSLLKENSDYKEIEVGIKNFIATLEANPSLGAIITPQLEARKKDMNKFLNGLFAKSKKRPGGTNDSNLLKKNLKELESIVSNLKVTLSANPSLSAVIKPQIESKEKDILVIKEKLEAATFNIEKFEADLKELESTVSNLRTALASNPAIAGVIQPQISAKEEQIKAAQTKIQKFKDQEDFTLSSTQENALIENLLKNVQIQKKVLDEINNDLLVFTNEEEKLSKVLKKITSDLSLTSERIAQLEGKSPTELVETNSTLRLVYKRDAGDEGEGRLVDSFPNEVPLFRDRAVYTLGVESLLAYYGLDEKNVRVSEDNLRFLISDNAGETLIEAPLEEKQFLEVNWFSSWSEKSPEKILVMEAKRAYGEEDFNLYISLVPQIFEKFLAKVKNYELPKSIDDYPSSMQNLGLDNKVVEIARKLLSERLPREEIPSFDQLMSVIEAISYYFIPSSLDSNFNPMCGMRDVIQNSRFLDQVESTITSITKQIEKLEGPTVLGAINNALLQNPENGKLLAQKKQVEDAILTNKNNLAVQEDELFRINEFFSRFENAIILVGPEEATFQDLAPTPFDKSASPKVGVHGNLIKTLTSGFYIKRLSIEVDHAATLGVGVIMALLAVYQGARSSWVQAGGIILLLGYVFFGFITFSNTHVVWPITAPACAGISTSFIGLAVMVVIEQKAKGRLKGMFGSYVSSELVEQMVESGEEPSLGGQETAITAFFSDVQAFSSFSELLSPTGLVDLMNEYLTAMTNILQEERGTLDKYIGDAIVAMYGAPIPMDDHAYQSVRTAILMQQEQIKLREKWSREEEKWGKCHGLVSKMQTRIGCNTGTATVGNMGALDRFNYTMMGDMVNLAARCESGAKAYGAYIMITEETMLASKQTQDDIAFRYLDRIVVKGRKQPVAMFEPTGFMSELTQETQDCLDCFKQGIDNYLKQDWDGALGMFEKSKGFEPNKPGITPGVVDNPSIILIDRCKIMKENPPGKDWDGVYVMTSK